MSLLYFSIYLGLQFLSPVCCSFHCKILGWLFLDLFLGSQMCSQVAVFFVIVNAVIFISSSSSCLLLVAKNTLFKKIFHLFIWLCWVLVAAGELLSCSSQAPQLQHMGSLVVACELLVAACMRDLVPCPGIKPGPPAMGAWSLDHCATREVPQLIFVFQPCILSLAKFIFFKFIYLFIYFLAVLGLRCCARAFSSCGERGLLFVAVCGLLIVVASLVVEPRLQGMQASVVVACELSSCGLRALEHRLGSCGTQAQLLRGMWDLPAPGIEPVSPALARGLLTTAPPGKSLNSFFFFLSLIFKFIYGCVGSSFLREGFLQLRQVGSTPHRGARASHYRGLSCCGAQAPDAQAQQLWLTGLVAPRHVGSSQTRARTRVPCTGRQTLNHCATREAPIFNSSNYFIYFLRLSL